MRWSVCWTGPMGRFNERDTYRFAVADSEPRGGPGGWRTKCAMRDLERGDEQEQKGGREGDGRQPTLEAQRAASLTHLDRSRRASFCCVLSCCLPCSCLSWREVVWKGGRGEGASLRRGAHFAFAGLRQDTIQGATLLLQPTQVLQRLRQRKERDSGIPSGPRACVALGLGGLSCAFVDWQPELEYK